MQSHFETPIEDQIRNLNNLRSTGRSNPIRCLVAVDEALYRATEDPELDDSDALALIRGAMAANQAALCGLQIARNFNS